MASSYSMFLLFSPLEQFEINNFVFSYFNYKINFFMYYWEISPEFFSLQYDYDKHIDNVHEICCWCFDNNYGRGGYQDYYGNNLFFLSFLKKMHLFLNFFVATNIFFPLFSLLLILIFLYVNINNDAYIFPKTYLYYTTLFIYNLIMKLLNDQLVIKERYKFVKLMTIVFVFLCFSNFLGMVPYSFATTGQFIIAFALAFNLFLWMNIIGICTLKAKFFNIFLPSGTPFFISPFIIFLEFVSYISRLLSLSVRLFANIMAGHTLTKILVFFAWTMLLKFGIWVYSSILLLFVIFLITLLEMGIAFVQSYIFCILTIIYLNTYFESH